jgi:hypothetical protein
MIMHGKAAPIELSMTMSYFFGTLLGALAVA